MYPFILYLYAYMYGYIYIHIHDSMIGWLTGLTTFLASHLHTARHRAHGLRESQWIMKVKKIQGPYWNTVNLWLFLVPVKGGRWHIIPQLAVYTTYIPLIYWLLRDYMLPTTFYGNQKQPLSYFILYYFPTKFTMVEQQDPSYTYKL